MTNRLKFSSISSIETRITNRADVGGGEGFSVSTATFDGKPAVVVNQSTLLDLLDEDGPGDAVLVHVFGSETERQAFVSKLRLE